MDITTKLTESGIVITNNGNAQSIPLGGSNAFELPNGASIQPLGSTYWHVSSLSGGALLEGTHGPLNMPKGSSAIFQADTL